MDEVEYWLKGADKQNFGDFLSDYFFGRLFVPLPSRFHRVHVIGSVIDDRYISLAKSHRNPSEIKSDLISFWGCGLRENRLPSTEIKSESNFLAVRGILTRELLELPKETPIGDPGLLLPFIFSAKNDCNNLNVLVPHILDARHDDELISITGCDQVLRPEVENSVESLENFLDALLKAKFVLCGSLHAAIIRLAYGLPFGYWDSGSIDIPFKWDDFSSSVGIETKFHKSIQCAHEHWSDSLQDSIKFPSLVKLLLASPYPVYPSVLFKAEEFDRGSGTHKFDCSDDSFVSYWSREADFYNVLIDKTKKTLISADLASERANHAEVQAAQASERANHAEVQAAQANKRANHAEVQAAQANKRANHAEVQAAQANERANYAEAHANVINQQYLAVVHSRSWKLTKPLRLAGKFARWFVRGSIAWLAFRPGSRPRRIISKAIERSVKMRDAIINKSIGFIKKSPRLKRIALKVINRFPALGIKLRRNYISSQFTESSLLVTPQTRFKDEAPDANQKRNPPLSFHQPVGMNAVRCTPLETHFKTYEGHK